ncbi:MAG: SIR2 family protein [Thermoplasmata archaeon]
MTTDYRLLYFLGAGAARPCGFQTTAELYHSLVGEEAGLALFQKFGGSLKAVTEGLPVDIETLYTMASSNVDETVHEMYSAFDSPNLTGALILDVLRRQDTWHGKLEELKAAFAEAGEAILRFIARKFWEVEPTTDPYKELYLELACRTLGFENVAVFTTNYDTSLERMLSEEFPYPFTTGLAGDRFLPLILHQLRGESLRIVKLHGSLDLYQLSDGRIVRINYRASPGRWSGDAEILGPYLVPPEEGKVSYDETQEQLLRMFEEAVKEADAMAIVGSSLRDSRLATILAEASEECHILLACGSKSSDLQAKWFAEQEYVQTVAEHFPNESVKEWLIVQITRQGAAPK